LPTTGGDAVNSADVGTEVDDGRLDLLLTSPRVPAGLLSREAWRALEQAELVLCWDRDDPTPLAVLAAGIAVEPVVEPAVEPAVPGDRTTLARELVARSAGRHLVWLGSPDGDPGLTDALAVELSRAAAAGGLPVVEVLVGSHDVRGARLLDLVAVMDRLRSPGGCPWDAEQTPTSLVRYLLEEAYEAVEALEDGDPAQVREELGDVLLQVVFHARMAQEDAEHPFDIDDVASGLVTKLVRRHPHVFDPEAAADAPRTAADVEEGWHQMKATEKSRVSVLDGVPLALPALARAEKVLGRIDRAALASQDRAEVLAPVGDPLADAVLDLVRRARAEGVDPEGAVRAAVRVVERRARAAPAQPPQPAEPVPR
jgi:XTP/dITP diphosphohydrolase